MPDLYDIMHAYTCFNGHTHVLQWSRTKPRNVITVFHADCLQATTSVASTFINTELVASEHQGHNV